jgi:hypothetical protein
MAKKRQNRRVKLPVLRPDAAESTLGQKKMPFGWVRNVSITPTTSPERSFAGCAANWARPKLSLQRRTNWPEYRMLRTKEPYNESVFLRLDREAIKRAQDRLRKHAAKLGVSACPTAGN